MSPVTHIDKHSRQDLPGFKDLAGLNKIVADDGGPEVAFLSKGLLTLWITYEYINIAIAYEYHPHFDQIADPKNTTLFRYMRLDKLEKLLVEKASYFCKIKEFADEEEGFVEHWKSDNLKKELNVSDVSEIFTSTYNKARERAKEFVFASCWNINEEESSVMWRSDYGQNKEDNIGVCIKTNVQKLYDSIIDVRSIHSGVIRYRHKFEPTLENIFTDCFIKSTRFKEERELRLWYVSNKFHDQTISHLAETGINVCIDPEALISEIIINPNSNSEDFKTAVDRIGVLTDNFEIPIVQSKIKYKPQSRE